MDDASISEDEEGGARIGDIYIPPPVAAHCSAESKGPRLIIHRIENLNFKSYAGKVILGPFHERFTAIIGPNGSGKSNVIDSMLFVFGYRASKIRCKKISTLLHNSAQFPNINECSVGIYFRQIEDREDGTFFVVPNSEIVIRRHAFRDNSSHYTINERRVQFKEVAKLLKKYHVDLDHNRFLILQGEVESIAMMKPKGLNDNECGMLEYLEDIVGTTRYKEPLLKINERVEQLTEERSEKHNRCKLAERDMKDLEQPYNEGVQFLVAENENTRTKNLRIQKYLSEKNKKLEEYKNEIDLIKTEIQEHEKKMDETKFQREEKENLNRKQTEDMEKFKKIKEDLDKKLDETKRSYIEVHQIMTSTNTRRKQNKKQLDNHEENLKDLKKIPDKNQIEIEECKKKLEKLEQKMIEMKEELQNNYKLYEKQTRPLIESREKFETDLIELKKNVHEAKSQVTITESKLQILKRSETNEMRKLESMKISYSESEKSLEDKRNEINTLKAQQNWFKKEILERTQMLQKTKTDEVEIQKNLLKLKSEIEEKAKIVQASKSNKLLHLLMRQKHEGKIPGILGRLGDLGAIDAKYDVAISTACGRLDNIVVDSVDTAQQCIEYLKENDIGRASFIALEKVKYLANQSGQIKTPEGVPRLYDLIRVEDERVLPAFYFGLRNTLVANDLDQATRIGYGAQRFRIVTLDGGLIEVSGTMSGGGRHKLKGKMGTTIQTKTRQSLDKSSVSQQSLEDAQILAEELQSKINFGQEEQGRFEREIRDLKTKLNKNENEVGKLSILCKNFEEQLPRILKQLEMQKIKVKESTTDPEKVKLFEAEIEIKKQELITCEKVSEKVEKEIEAINLQVNKIHGDKIKCVQKKIDQIQIEMDRLNANVSKLTVEINTSKRNVTKVEKQIDNLKSEIKKAEDEIRELSTKRDAYDAEKVELGKKIEQADADIKGLKLDFPDYHKEINDLRKLEGDLKLARVKIDQKLQTVKAKLSEVKAQIPYWRDQLKPLKLNVIPGTTKPLEPLIKYSEEELDTFILEDIQYAESVQEESLKKMTPNLSCIAEYVSRQHIYLERVKFLEDITSKRNEMRQLYDDVRKKRYNEFMQGFHTITRKLKEMYQMITQGGDAELELVDSMDPFTEGVSFSVRPPKKSWKNISNLSGGEKTLSSLALVFALHYYKPSPLYFMDEIDAALDFKNISIVAHYIKERTKNAQFIIISLRSNMFELSDYLVGIYKVKDCTDSVTIKNHVDAPFLTRPSQVNLQIDDNEQSDEINTTLVPPNISAHPSQLQENLEKSVSNMAITDVPHTDSSAELFKKPLPRDVQNETIHKT